MKLWLIALLIAAPLASATACTVDANCTGGLFCGALHTCVECTTNSSSASHIAVSGIHASDVAPTITGPGYINVVNDGAHVAATVTGTGTISITNEGAATSATLTGSGAISIVNDGGVVTATNTGDGVLKIISTCSAAVSVTITNGGDATVYATGTGAIALSYADGLNHVYPDDQAPLPHLLVSGVNASDVTEALTGLGYINVVNNGSHVAATETGSGTVGVVNTGGPVTATETGSGSVHIFNSGGVVTATNTGNGVMTIYGTCTAAVTVTNTGDGDITVYASGSDPITLTYTDGLNHVYPLVHGSCADGLVCTLAGECVECYSNDQCTGLAYICSAENVCVQCVNSTQCGVDLLCSPDGECVGCYLDGQCGEGLICSPDGTCVVCYSDAQCVSEDAPYCSPTGHVCVECTSDEQCAETGCVGVCNLDHICTMTCGLNCSYGQGVWVTHINETVDSVAPVFLPLLVTSVPMGRGNLGVILGTSITITTRADLITALNGFESTTPVHTLAAILAITLLNLERGAVPTAEVSAALIEARLIVYDCYAATFAQWETVVTGATTCGDFTFAQIGKAFMTLYMFNEGWLIPSCPTSTFPLGTAL